jgi:hypothetical protein
MLTSRALKEHQSVSNCPFRKIHFKRGARMTVTVSSIERMFGSVIVVKNIFLI